ncbi:MAG TPA: SEC-C metal-binding domain-containing protein [Bryobacteraceae bacterium]|nr:SEC-C metal-binding domain-containing protein [Bryobacteraceae bacterium]
MYETSSEITVAPVGGPRTPEGKSIASRNATKHGLYAASDYILPGEEEEFTTTQTALMTELAPEGILEQLFADEIMTASWRLRRCRIIESTFAEAPDPASNESIQRAVDRARAASHNIIRKSTAELRRLQTERAIRAQLGTADETPGLADTRQIQLALKSAPLEDDPAEPTPAAQRPVGITLQDLETLMAQADQRLCDDIRANGASSFRKTPANAPIRASNAPRNAPCPCRSGKKYKKCCGNPAAERPAIAA